MTIAQIMRRMIEEAGGNHHDINHFMKVWAYARTIGALEGLDEATLFTLEAAAIVHDIACPLCREKYGRADGSLQELESEPLVRAFLADTGMRGEDIDRVALLVRHHHTPGSVEGMDHRILIEADYIACAMENRFSREEILRFAQEATRTDAGRRILKETFGL